MDPHRVGVSHPGGRGAARGVAALALLCASAALPALRAQHPNECDVPGEYPDVIVGNLDEVHRWGAIGNVTAFSVGTVSCNVGTCWLNWIASTPDHPVIGQNMYRLRDGRFEQLGQSWLKHGFTALSQTYCSTGCIGTDGDHLGVLCSDPYVAELNGYQVRLGPKFEVNAYTGAFPFPYTAQGQTGDTLYKRLQVTNADLAPSLNPGAKYFVEGQYVSADDAAAGRAGNNASYREVLVTAFAGQYDANVTAATRPGPALTAWRAIDPAVSLTTASAPGDGLFFLGSKTTSLGGGSWHYEYALFNMNSHRSARSFTVRLPAGANVSHVGFHDVHYHSGEPFDGTDWVASVGGGTVSWTTSSFDQAEFANALRWGTLYNFRFDADVAPVSGVATIGLFRPGSPGEIGIVGTAPSLCNGDGTCGPGEDCASCAADCANQGGGGGCCGDGFCNPGESSCTCSRDCDPPPALEFSCGDGVDEDCDAATDCGDRDCCADAVCDGPDGDGDGFALCDCDDASALVWSAPGEVTGLTIGRGPGGAELSWDPPFEPGAESVTYETLRALNPINFTTSTTCLPSAGSAVSDGVDPAPGDFVCYLVRARNDCPEGAGSLGRSSDGQVRQGTDCS